MEGNDGNESNDGAKWSKEEEQPLQQQSSRRTGIKNNPLKIIPNTNKNSFFFKFIFLPFTETTIINCSINLSDRNTLI